jgi:hypothetical protein
MTSPFTYWEAREMISYLDGICFPHHRPKVSVEIFGDLHNAYVDACKQIEEMFVTIKQMKGEDVKDFPVGSKGKY